MTSLNIWSILSSTEISCRTFQSSLRDLDWCLTACCIFNKFFKIMINCLIWSWNSTRVDIRLLIANFFSKYTHFIHLRFTEILTDLLFNCNEIENWYLATKSKMHLKRWSLTWNSISSCSFTYKFIERWDRFCCCTVTTFTNDLSRNWWKRLNSSRFDDQSKDLKAQLHLNFEYLSRLLYKKMSWSYSINSSLIDLW